ncbi:hypothetical protein ACNF42_08165, partial [Cuniculiplasma sp. SKW3]|uniref:hypothetical protein n=1 Tax=Cuniculiplasma sp. SKW3 TaxID=3400170 RepID=UPI003FD25BA1
WITTGGNFGSKNITYNLSDNPYVVDVFNGRSDSYGMITGYVNSPSLLNIAQAWRYVVQNQKYRVSLMEEATYSYIRNNTLYGFDYFNNIEYSPFNPVFNSIESFEFYHGMSPLNLSSTVYFNLSKPVFERKINGSATPNMVKEKSFREIGGGGGGGNGNPCTPSVVDKTIKIETWTGMLPLLYSSMNLPSYSDFVLSSTGVTANITMEFNSAQYTQNQSGTFQSTTSSYEATLPYSSETAIDLNVPGENMSINYISNVSFEALEFRPYYITTQRNNDGTYYCVATPGPTVTTMQVIGANNPQVKVSYVYNVANNGNASETADYWSTAINMLGITPSHAYQLGVGDVYSSLDLSYIANESNNANNYLEQVENGVSVFSAAVGVAFAINAITDIIPLAGSAEDLADELTLAFAEIGLLTSIAAALTSISIIVQESITLNTFTLDNFKVINTDGSPLEVYFYQSSDTVHFYGNAGDEYSFNPSVSLAKELPI